MSSSKTGSRQRNCNACVKSKRRCDKAQPACGRCVKQRYLCIYGGRAEVGLLDDLGPSTLLPALADTFSALPETNLGLDSNTTFEINNDFSSLLAPMPGTNNFLADSWPSQFIGIPAGPAEKSLTRRDYSEMVPECGDYAPWQLSDPSTKPFFTLSVFKRFHVSFAHDGRTLYIHRHLYKDNMPRWVLQAFTTCLLYANRTDANRAIVLRVLHENVTDLKETAAASAPLTPLEKLARVHAIVFYQTIRMFDGDVTLAQQADDDMALLEAWNKDLCKVKDNLDDLATMADAARKEHPPESWERWIFAESLRRTCVMCICIQKFWALLKTRLKAADVSNWTFLHRWTLSSHLWDAPSSFAFFRAWRERPFHVISMFDFSDFLKAGVGDDLDDFGFFFLTLYFGVNEIKTFCYETSGRLMTI